MSAKAAATMSSETLAARGKMSAYFELTKARVVSMVLVTTLAGFYLAAPGGLDLAIAINLLIGTALAAAGTLALNQYVERDTDALMLRTQHRPVPDGRLRPVEALVFGLAATGAGLIYLALATNWLCTAVTAAITIVYLFAYTPLKRVTWACDIVGAIPGALPPVAGWAAVRGSISAQPMVMFAIMFLWQLPHTFAVARLYRSDYARAGIKLLPDDARWGNPSDIVVIVASIALIAVGIAPTLMGAAGVPYLAVAAVLGVAMLGFGIAMVRAPLRPQPARRLLFASLVYLPIVLLMMVVDKL
jgi:protoheme IX farnesyltransferase